MEITTTQIKASPRKLIGTWTVEVLHGMDSMYLVDAIWIRKAYHGEWAIDIPLRQWHDAIAWCKEAFGTDGNHSRHRWRISHSEKNCRIFLRNEADLLMFRLKWL
jgi:hypothetical protein